MMGADLRGLAATLAAHEELTAEGPVRSTVAWTVPGKALRRGVAVGFPDPVGARWGRPVADGIEVPIAGSWAGAAVTVMARRHGRTVQRLVGVADQREHLEAAVANDDPAEARRLLDLFDFTEAQRRHVEGLIEEWERSRGHD